MSHVGLIYNIILKDLLSNWIDVITLSILYNSYSTNMHDYGHKNLEAARGYVV